jgi:uncharacterized protein
MEPASIRRTALITGGSSGIGLALARQFGNAGYQLVLVARDAARLDAQALALGMQVCVPIIAIAKDLCRPGACAELVAELEGRDLTVTALVNNAGVGVYGAFSDSDLEAMGALIALNITALTALTALTRLLLPGMLARRHGRILNVASTAAFQPGPLWLSTLPARPTCCRSPRRSRPSWRGSGVTVTCLCPGPTATGFAARARMGASRLFQRGVMDSDSVAAGISALVREAAQRQRAVEQLLEDDQIAQGPGLVHQAGHALMRAVRRRLGLGRLLLGSALGGVAFGMAGGMALDRGIGWRLGRRGPGRARRRVVGTTVLLAQALAQLVDARRPAGGGRALLLLRLLGALGDLVLGLVVEVLQVFDQPHGAPPRLAAVVIAACPC